MEKPINPVIDELQKHIVSSGGNGIPESDESRGKSLEAFVKALEYIMSSLNIDQKSDLTDENIEGIVKLLTFNDYMEIHFGFRIRPYDIAIAQKMIKVISRDRQGRKELIELFREMKLDIEGSDTTSATKRMIVVR